MQYELKILPQYFKAVKEGRKTFEIRKNDRGFKVGDTLLLKEYVFPYTQPLSLKEGYTGQEITKEVSYILEGGQYGLEEGYCILGLKDIEVISDKEKQEFQLGDTAYMIDDDYRLFEEEVYRIELDNGEYYYITYEVDFEFKDIGKWVFKSELYRELHLENMNSESEE